MKTVISPNAFKGSLDAFKAAEAIQKGLEISQLNCESRLLPIADGGDGTMSVLVNFFDGEYITTQVLDPLGRPLVANFGLIDDGRVAVIEIAEASGIRHLRPSELNPIVTSTFGTGELINKALEYRVNEVIVALGGSATVDGGIGALVAMGVQFKGDGLSDGYLGGGTLRSIQSVDTSRLDERIEDVKFTLLCDVDNYLLGPKGAASIFGPQKGASHDMVVELEQGLANFARVSNDLKKIEVEKTERGGAAGGCGAFFSAYLNAEIKDGITYLLDRMGFEEVISDADLLITAEGRIDEQTKHGKGPYGVAQLAGRHNVPVIALSGQVDPNLDTRHFDAFNSIVPIGNGPCSLDEAITQTETNLIRTSQQIGNMLAISSKLKA